MRTVERCGLGCHVCQFHELLVDLGAQYHQSDHLIENECDVRISVSASALCMTTLKMDLEKARYRQRSSSSNITRMCDFTVVLALEGVTRYCAIELKSREPYLSDAVEQLEEGIRAIVDNIVDRSRKPRLRAILVVGVMSPRLIRLARSPEGRLPMTDHEIQVELADCGKPLRI